MAKVLSYFSHWRPTISPDPVTGAPTVSVAIERSNTEYTVKSIFEYLKQSSKEVYIAIDEFQTITDYPEQGTEALLRSYIQFIHNVHFIFSGSKQHLMYEMFGSPKRPFYQSTAMMTLQSLHDLPSASSIKKALTVLQDKDLVYQTQKGYIVYDRFLDLWLKRTFI